MSGERPSSRPRDRVASYLAEVEEYSRILGLLPPDPLAEECLGYFGAPYDEIGDWCREEASRAHLQLGRYAARIHQATNEARVKAGRCKELIDRRTINVRGQYSAFKDEDKRLQAILDDAGLTEYHDMQKANEAFLTYWDGRAKRLEDFAWNLQHAHKKAD